MNALAKRIVVWLMLLTIPIQGMAAVTSAVQGPAHVHAATTTVISPQPRHTHAASRSVHDHQRHDQVRRHYHLPGEGAVLVPDHRHDDIVAVEERTSKGESVSAAFVALLPASLALHLSDLRDAASSGSLKKMLSYIAPRIERPPRL